MQKKNTNKHTQQKTTDEENIQLEKNKSLHTYDEFSKNRNTAVFIQNYAGGHSSVYIYRPTESIW